MEWFVRIMEPDDHDAYVDFLSQWITHIPVKEHYQWLYQDNPHGKALTWLAVWKENKEIIGCTSIFPKKMWVKGKIVSGCVGGDAFVNPKFRRRGIAKKLHEVTLEGMKKIGIQFMYGFPVASNFGAFRKVGAFYPGDFSGIRLLLRCEPILEKLRLPGQINSWPLLLGNSIISRNINRKLSKFFCANARLKEISKFDSDINRLVDETISSLGISCIRDNAYLNWRYFKNPVKIHRTMAFEIDQELLGFTALEFSAQTCTLFDFFVRNDDRVINSLITEIIKLAYSKGCSRILFSINPNGPYVGNFLQCGFKLRKRRFLKPLILLADCKDKDAFFLNDISNWYLTTADLDIEAVGNG